MKRGEGVRGGREGLPQEQGRGRRGGGRENGERWTREGQGGLGNGKGAERGARAGWGCLPLSWQAQKEGPLALPRPDSHPVKAWVQQGKGPGPLARGHRAL